MSRIIQVESFRQNNKIITCQVKPNKYTDTQITIIKLDLFDFLERHSRLKYADIMPLTINEYLENESINNIHDDLSDYIVAKIIDFDIIFSDIFNHIQKLAKC